MGEGGGLAHVELLAAALDIALMGLHLWLHVALEHLNRAFLRLQLTALGYESVAL